MTMKNIWKLMMVVGFVLTISVGINSINAQTSSANSYTTPKSIRGHWYGYSKYNKHYSVMVIHPHSVAFYNQSLSKRISHYDLYSPHMSGLHKLKVNIAKHRSHGSNNVYTLNQAKYDYQSLGMYWSSHKTLFGQRHHVLKSYSGMGAFYVFFHHKIKHDYSYTHIKNYEYFIGR